MDMFTESTRQFFRKVLGIVDIYHYRGGYVLFTTVATTVDVLENITALRLCYNQRNACDPQGT